MHKLCTSLLALALAVPTAAACSSGTSTGGGSPSGVASDKRLADLNNAEEGKLCDFFAARFGGYGARSTVTCPAGSAFKGSSTVTAPPGQALCVSGFMEKIPDTCPMTVSEAESCFVALGGGACESASGIPASCLPLTQPICGPVLGITSGPLNDGGVTDASSDAADGAPPGGACPGNTKQKAPLVSAACQSALESACSAELTACFGIVAPAGADDCNRYAACIPRCRLKADGFTPETDEAKISACQDDCDALATKSVQVAYDAIATCTTNHPATNATCQ